MLTSFIGFPTGLVVTGHTSVVALTGLEGIISTECNGLSIVRIKWNGRENVALLRRSHHIFDLTKVKDGVVFIPCDHVTHVGLVLAALEVVQSRCGDSGPTLFCAEDRTGLGDRGARRLIILLLIGISVSFQLCRRFRPGWNRLASLAHMLDTGVTTPLRLLICVSMEGVGCSSAGLARRHHVHCENLAAGSALQIFDN